MGELTGTTFAGLEVGDAIGRDLVSTIYSAVDTGDDRRVVVRVVSEDLRSAEGTERALYRQFLHRAAAALTFEHVNAPQVEEVGEHRGRGYLVTSAVDTVALADHLDAHGPLDIDTALDLFTQIADVLDAIHRSGLQHGAVNPTTLRLVRTAQGVEPRVRLTGFGTGALLELRLRRDRRHLDVVDELLYVAPEQLRRQPLTGRADQYAMACAFVHTVSGAPPFVRDSVGGLFGAHLFVEPALQARPSDGPIRRALAKDPGDRYATCGELISDIRRAEGRAQPPRRAVARHRETARDTAASPDADTGAEMASTRTDVGDDEPRGPRGAADRRVPSAGTTGDEVGVTARASWPAVAAAAVDEDDAIHLTEDGRRIIALPEYSGTTSGEPVARAEGTPANGLRQRQRWTGDAAKSDDSFSTEGGATADIAYPTVGSEADAVTPTAIDDVLGYPTAEGDDSVPLLSEVLRERPPDERSGTWRPSAGLVALWIVAVVATAAVVWMTLS